MQKIILFGLLVLLVQGCKPNESTPTDQIPDVYTLQNCSQSAGRDSGETAAALVGTWNLRRKFCPSNGGEVTVTAPVRLEVLANHSLRVYSGSTLLDSASWSVRSDSVYSYPYAQWRIATEPAVDWTAGAVYICEPYVLFSNTYYGGQNYSCDHVFQRQ